jgi:aromatic ring-opening dioxygenase LigB subunit
MADDDTIRARVEKASICAYKAMILTGEDLEEEKRKELINHYIGLAEQYNMTHASEHKLATEYFAEIRS